MRFLAIDEHTEQIPIEWKIAESSCEKLSANNGWIDAPPHRRGSAGTFEPMPNCSARPYSGTLRERQKTYEAMRPITDGVGR